MGPPCRRGVSAVREALESTVREPGMHTDLRERLPLSEGLDRISSATSERWVDVAMKAALRTSARPLACSA